MTDGVNEKLKDLYDNFEVKIFGVSKKEEIKNFKEFVKK